MNEYAVTAAIVAAGALAGLPVLPAVGRWGYAVVIVPVGFVAYLVVGVALLTVAAFSTVAALAVGVGVGLVGAGWWWLAAGRGRVGVSDILLPVGVVAVAAAVVVAIASSADLTRFSPDSLQYLGIAGALERVGSLETVDSSRLVIRLVGVALLHTPGVGGAGYMVSWTPLLGISGVVLTGWLGHRALALGSPPPRRSALIVGSVLALVVTTNRVIFNLFYVNSHMAFATFLVLGVGVAWYAAVTRRWVLLVPAAAGFAALPLLRPEGVIVALLFMIPLVVDHRLAQRHRWLMVTPLAAVTVLWHGIAVPSQLSADRLTLTGPVLSNLAGIAALVVLVLICGVDRRRRLVPWVVPAVPVVIAGYVAVRALRWWEPFTLALSATGANLAFDGLWATFWWVVPVLFVMAAVVVRLPLQRVFVYPLATWPLTLLLFSYLREGDGYRVGAGDSGNRMMMHIVFVAALYLIAAAGAAVRMTGSRTVVSRSVSSGSGPSGSGPSDPVLSGPGLSAPGPSGPPAGIPPAPGAAGADEKPVSGLHGR